jgi:hypothetical protein
VDYAAVWDTSPEEMAARPPPPEPPPCEGCRHAAKCARGFACDAIVLFVQFGVRQRWEPSCARLISLVYALSCTQGRLVPPHSSR